uniref:DRBM domain-containing protein n=1 Tax=Manihot esculenta TaxID=3983 RepID=A0A2C9VH18_MANES
MYKNQLQELAQGSCFNLLSYSCTREGPDHAPSELRQAEHSAAEEALTTLASRGPSRALGAKVLDETGVYKNLLQETAHRAGLKLPVYTTVRSGPDHVHIFSCTVELAGMNFTGELARTKKQVQKNAAMATWFAVKRSDIDNYSSQGYTSNAFLRSCKLAI